MAKRELTCTGVIVLNGAERDIETLNDDERKEISDVWHRRLSDSMSLYFSAHPEEYKALAEAK